MNLPDFHDGFFEGCVVAPDKTVRLIVSTETRDRFLVTLRRVQAMTLSGLKGGNIIFDLVLRDARSVTTSEITELYAVEPNTEQSAELKESLLQKSLQLLELTPSYGAEGLFLFESIEVSHIPAGVSDLFQSS